MATTCIQCSKKIGVFKKPVDGQFCSFDCRNLARALEEQRTQEALRQAQAEREREAREETERSHSEVVRRADSDAYSACPKCSQAWQVGLGEGPMGLARGACAHCGFSTEFATVEACPHCRCHSFVIDALGEGRCPRCKTRLSAERRRRLTA